MTRNILFSCKEIASALNICEKTFYTKLKYVKKKKKFKKSSTGYMYTKADALKLAKLMGYPIKL